MPAISTQFRVDCDVLVCEALYLKMFALGIEMVLRTGNHIQDYATLYDGMPQAIFLVLYELPV